MASVTDARGGPAAAHESAVTRFIRATEIDTRMLGMVGALLLIWLGFHIVGGIRSAPDDLFTGDGFAQRGVWGTLSEIWSDGVFLTPRNLWNLLVQTSVISVLSTGMVLVIVTRNIDLSVGSMLSFIGVVAGVSQAYWLGPWLGADNPFIWIIAVVVALGLGAILGAFNGFLVAYAGIPAFIVTLGGLIVYNGAAWWVIRGETVAPLDDRFERIGGNPREAWIGSNASWILGLVICAVIVWSLVSNRTQRRRFKFPQRPMWAEAFLGAIGCAATLAIVSIVNSYPWPPKIAETWANEHNIPVPPDGLVIGTGFAIPMLIALAVGFAMTFIADRTAFGRYIYAIGGNPEAADLAGINTKKITVMLFSLMGGLCGIGSCVASARLDAASNSLGQFDELYTIAAAVIGGTSLAGGIGTIYGAMLGALVMQSLQSGMELLNVDSAVRDVIVGSVLVFAVWLDQIYRRRQG